MSISTHTSSAQMPDRSPLLRGSSIGGPVFLNSSLRETLASFSLPVGPTIRQLYDLLLILDRKCLQHATDTVLEPEQDSASEVGTVVELALFLSGPLNKCGDSSTSLFEQIQLRALIASLALLQHNGVHTLDSLYYDNLRLKNISARFREIAFQVRRTSKLADRIRHAPNAYLVQLASQYVSFMRRGDSAWSSVFGPTMDILFSAISLGGGQYNHIRDIIGGINQLVNIWQKPRMKYQALCVLQEYTRLATSLCQESDVSGKSNELRTAATALVSALFEKADEILAVENTNFTPKLRRWHKVFATVSRGPPKIDQGDSFYGVLDCVSQLATVSDPRVLGNTLLDRLKDLIFDSVVPEFRWKAIEILLACHCTRWTQYQNLRKDVEVRSATENKADIFEEMLLIQDQLEKDESEKLRLRVARPLTCVPQRSATPDIIQARKSGLSTIPLDRGESSPIDIKKCCTFTLPSVRKFSSSYHSAGLLEGCHHAFLHNDREVSVYQLGDLRKNPASPNFSRVFTQCFLKQEYIRSITSSQAYISVVTTQRLLVYKIDAETPIDAIRHGDWDSSGLACHESETHVVVFLGQCRNKTNGQIKVYRYRIEDHQAKKLPVFTLNVPASDHPKRVFFDADSQLLTCITRIRSELLVWRLDDRFLSSSEPFGFLKNKYPLETRETGVTSATIYQSPSNRQYVLCTTAPSQERWRYEGEWSYIMLIPEDVSPQNPHQGSIIHNFEQLKDHSSLLAGCSSRQHHVFALLEDTGRLSVLRLDKHDDGGIHSPDEDTEILQHALCKQDRPLTQCLRFDPSGSFLFAVDANGKIVVTEFAKQ